MQDHPVLGQVALAYSPMIDSRRAVFATRLTVFPDRPDGAPDPQALLRALAEVWPEVAAGAPASDEPLRLAPRPFDNAAAGRAAPQAPRPPLSLNLAGEALLRRMLDASPGPGLMVEVPAFMASDPAQAPLLRRLHAEGTVLMVKGRPLAPLPPELLALFSHTIVEAADDQRAAAAVKPPRPGQRQMTTVQAGATTSAEIAAAFERGAAAVVGWPWADPPPAPNFAKGRAAVPSDVQVVMELIDGVERELPVQRLEATLKRDPTLAFRLLRYLNSPAFGLRVEISSFGHALMMLGYQRLKRWLALLLASSAKGSDARPLMYAALRRGLLMEELARDHGDADSGGEMFICGVFSLLDRLLQQPFSELLANLPVPDRVQQALRRDGSDGGEGADRGPYGPFLALVQAIEQDAVFDLRERAEALLLSPADVNRALLRALRAARHFDS